MNSDKIWQESSSAKINLTNLACLLASHQIWCTLGVSGGGQDEDEDMAGEIG
ncbi:hypothetical protein NEUTE1DRAFT_116048 [Neurospora tetrasperma FGSC 2508]|uniref:Uncharacterized protein n=1 Tax=Neurospora tetrasperma (strain FGSC 2508 / ATCC MYA-4615 / P0657) TaxID=510951 RepID=F8MC96_NEUT8|nr:uncharacterized protein NEUTE1DRAFT_116048 [Neurospora tetrasperma FGSC 2508]EGO61251.1 hypothetical protein NEUTE1DRAFT_116048 [Neurospora tetrasperma FGSC 2508]EGZ74742.1 hypothetical protein NEUTE2DRAFT_143436 [Neurospora tetrasperma FGSC 2509]